MRDWLADPDVDLSRDAWLVADEVGTANAWGWVAAAGGSDHLDLDYYVDPAAPPGLASALLDLLENRAAEVTTLTGHRRAVADKALYRSDTAGARLLEGRGYRVATTFNRMRVDLDDPVDGTTPPGVAIRRVGGRDAEADLRAAFAIKQVSFAEHFGHVPREYDDWVRSLDARSDVDWSQLWLAELDGEPVGMLLGTDQFAADENAGYVLTLGVLPAGRGRGVAKALLREHFREQQRRGRTAALLHVDTANVTSALQLYESVGMRPVLQLDVWRKEIACG